MVTTYPERHTISEALAAKLASARKARGWSIRQAARRVGCTPGSIVHWEAARRAPSAYYAHQVITAYGLDDDDAGQLWDEAVPDAGMSSPRRGGQRHR